MPLIRDNSPGAHAVTVRCLHCGTRKVLAECIVDTEGPPFRAYFCDHACESKHRRGEARSLWSEWDRNRPRRILYNLSTGEERDV